MAPPNSVDASRKIFSLEEANRTLPLVRAIVTDIVKQFRVVDELRQRLASLSGRRRGKATTEDPYAEELAATRTGLETEEARLREYVDELEKLGVELKGPDGLCDFPSEIDGRPVYLCWRLGEADIRYWHELNTGFAGRQPIESLKPARPPAERCSS